MSDAANTVSIDWITDGWSEKSPGERIRILEDLFKGMDSARLLPLFNALCIANPKRTFFTARVADLEIGKVVYEILRECLSYMPLSEFTAFLPHIRDLEQARRELCRDKADELDRMHRDARLAGMVLCTLDRWDRVDGVIVDVDPDAGSMRVACCFPEFDYPKGLPTVMASQRRAMRRLSRFSGNTSVMHSLGIYAGGVTHALGIHADGVTVLDIARVSRGTGHAYRAVPALTKTVQITPDLRTEVVEPRTLES